MKEIEKLWEETRELNLGTTISHLTSPPTPLQFLRDFISQNKPCIISNAISHWPALTHWPHPQYLSRALSTSLVSLHLTPSGRADSIISNTFASAHVQRLPFPLALDMVLSSRNGRVGYLQQQNDCFREEFVALASDCDGEIEWASEALGLGPEAVNLWIGNEYSETSFHKDHYENLYAVVSGQKHFLLLPPTDVHRLYLSHYPAASYSYHEESEEFTLEMEEPERLVPWCSVNPYPSPEMEESEKAKFPLYFNGPKPFECTVNAGEILYLLKGIQRIIYSVTSTGSHRVWPLNIRPSMWFHHVRQSPGEGGCTVAINYWYDMQFDIKYAYFDFLQSIHYTPKMAIGLGDSGSDAYEGNSDEDINEG